MRDFDVSVQYDVVQGWSERDIDSSRIPTRDAFEIATSSRPVG